MTTAMLVAHMYSSEARSREACAMLHDSGVSKMLVDALSAALQTRKSSDGKAQEFSKAELLHGLQVRAKAAWDLELGLQNPIASGTLGTHAMTFKQAGKDGLRSPSRCQPCCSTFHGCSTPLHCLLLPLR